MDGNIIDLQFTAGHQHTVCCLSGGISLACHIRILQRYNTLEDATIIAFGSAELTAGDADGSIVCVNLDVAFGDILSGQTVDGDVTAAVPCKPQATLGGDIGALEVAALGTDGSGIAGTYFHIFGLDGTSGDHEAVEIIAPLGNGAAHRHVIQYGGAVNVTDVVVSSLAQVAAGDGNGTALTVVLDIALSHVRGDQVSDDHNTGSLGGTVRDIADTVLTDLGQGDIGTFKVTAAVTDSRDLGIADGNIGSSDLAALIHQDAVGRTGGRFAVTVYHRIGQDQMAALDTQVVAAGSAQLRIDQLDGAAAVGFGRNVAAGDAGGGQVSDLDTACLTEDVVAGGDTAAAVGDGHVGAHQIGIQITDGIGLSAGDDAICQLHQRAVDIIDAVVAIGADDLHILGNHMTAVVGGDTVTAGAAHYNVVDIQLAEAGDII